MRADGDTGRVRNSAGAAVESDAMDDSDARRELVDARRLTADASTAVTVTATAAVDVAVGEAEELPGSPNTCTAFAEA